MEEVTLNLPGRDRKIEEYKQYLRNLGRAGIYYTTYAHMGNGIWSSTAETTRGGAPARASARPRAGQCVVVAVPPPAPAVTPAVAIEARCYDAARPFRFAKFLQLVFRRGDAQPARPGALPGVPGAVAG